MPRYTDTDELRNAYKEWFELYSWGEGTDSEKATIARAIQILDEQPTVDIVRCYDCKHWVSNMRGCGRNPSVESWKEDDYCSYGERREDE